MTAEDGRPLAGNVTRYLRGNVGVTEEAVQFDGVNVFEIVDGVVAILRAEDIRVTAACGGTGRRLEIAPHVIVGTSSADETVCATIGTAICGASITD
jgi:hypothetical protein